MNQPSGISPPERIYSRTAAQATETRPAAEPVPHNMSAAIARPFSQTLPPILSGHEQGFHLPPIRRISDTPGFSQPVSNPNTGPVSPTSTVSSGFSRPINGNFHTSSQVPYGINTSPSRAPENHGPVSMQYNSGGKRRRFANLDFCPYVPKLIASRSTHNTYESHTATAYGIPHSNPVSMSGPQNDMTTSHIVAPTSIPKDRFTLHLRQQPRAARAGPDGKDRR